MTNPADNLKGKDILIVEDQPGLAELLLSTLSHFGMRVSAADRGAKALEQLEGQTPDVILLDLMLPDMDGLEIVRFVRGDARLKDVPIVVMTASFGRREECLRSHCNDFIAKPFNPQVLVGRIAALLSLRSR
jgi:CheY-like chemotaxis protein